MQHAPNETQTLERTVYVVNQSNLIALGKALLIAESSTSTYASQAQSMHYIATRLVWAAQDVKTLLMENARVQGEENSQQWLKAVDGVLP